jgi:pre-mRNA cleavage complex 2 protein Pcf11
MHAYSQVDANVRRKLEEMLKTWREPVPGSTSTQPVFQHNATQGIVDNLNKFRASTIQQPRYPGAQAPTARLPSVQGFRNTPTPPQHNLPQRPPPPSLYPTAPNQEQYAAQQPLPYPAQTPTPQSHFSAPQPSFQPPGNHIDMTKLHADIDDLTTDAKIECATHPMDMAAQKKLTTLQTLKEILESGGASPSDLADIRQSIDQQMAKKASQVPGLPARPNYATAMPQVPAPPAPQYPNSQPQSHAPLPAGLNATSLADLLRATAGQNGNPQPPTYLQPPQQAAPIINTPPLAHTTPAPTTQAAFSLLDQLKAAGLVSAAPTPLQGITPPVYGLPAAPSPFEVAFTSASIKIPRSQMVLSFLTAKPNQCNTCGRRFASDEIGKEKKARHLDWHFKTKARMIEAEKHGSNRSWYVDERVWIGSKESSDEIVEDGVASVNTSPTKKEQDFVRAPSDPVLRAMPCPIDQEPFKSEWSEEVQDFIWKDAIHVGGRYYHASCYREVTKDRDKDAGNSTPLGAGLRTSTPDSVLGKRKAEQDANGTQPSSRVKVES